MDYREMTTEQLMDLKYQALKMENNNAAAEISDFMKFYEKTVEVIKGRKVPIGTVGKVFWIKRYDNSKYGDPWGIYSVTKAGIKDEDGNTCFTNINNLKVLA